MDVVGGVIVAADHGSDLVCGNRGVKRTSAVSKYHVLNQYHHHGGHGATMAVAWGGDGHEPWSYRHLKLGRTSNADADREAGNGVFDLKHEDYELRSVLSFRQSSSAVASQQQQPPMMHQAPSVVAPPAPTRSWADPLTFLLKKELTTTDVGDLGRIILPKRDAECQLPRLENKEGKLLCMEDYNSNKKWTLRYKWWPNNKSRMYVLESTGDFVKHYDLREKDEFVIYKDASGKLVIRGQKWSSSPLKGGGGGGGSFHAGTGFKGITPTGKRSPKGRSNLSKSNGSSNTQNSAAAVSTTTSVLSSSSTTAVLTTSVLSTTSVFTASYGGAVSVEPVVTLVGPGPYGVVTTADGSAIDWEKLPDPPAIEFSDPPAIEFPEEFECSWGESSF